MLEGIEIKIKELSFYHANKTDLSNILTEVLMNKELKIELNVDFEEINKKLTDKINTCLLDEDYFETNREWLSRIKTIDYKEKKYKLNLSEPKHYYFYELVNLYDMFNNSNSNSLSIKFIGNNE